MVYIKLKVSIIMKAIGMEPQVLIDILVGAKIGVVYPFGTDHRGDLVVTSYALKQAGLPSNMAGAAVQLEDVEETAPGNFVWKFNPEVTLIRPFKVHGTMELFDVEDQLIYAEPTNWFNVEAENAGHAKIDDWLQEYFASHPDANRVPRQELPEEIINLATSFDDWRAEYFEFLYKPTKAQKHELRTKRYDIDPL